MEKIAIFSDWHHRSHVHGSRRSNAGKLDLLSGEKRVVRNSSACYKPAFPTAKCPRL